MASCYYIRQCDLGTNENCEAEAIDPSTPDKGDTCTWHFLVGIILPSFFSFEIHLLAVGIIRSTLPLKSEAGEVAHHTPTPSLSPLR